MYAEKIIPMFGEQKQAESNPLCFFLVTVNRVLHEELQTYFNISEIIDLSSKRKHFRVVFLLSNKEQSLCVYL